ncbi:MAG: ABC-F family ATP-binding cassette domain-containing protein [Parasporobacterium sp.]|nr:ABC-F family ATP-binding cassette domain-containing protein [Parasporobacterium sp.]
MRLQIRNATVEYGADVILDKVNFEIHDREKIAVVGRNGCGKTTLMKLISGEVEPVNPDSDETFLMVKAGGQRTGYLQQINFSDKDISVRDEIRKVFEPIYECERRMLQIEANLTDMSGTSSGEERLLLNEYDSLQKKYDALGGHDAEREMEIMFAKFGFEPADMERPIGTFSGGQQTKVAFIKLLLSRPDILLLDEPTNHLDLPTIEWLEGYLKNYNKAVVIVSHDRVFLDNIVSVTYEIEYHRIKRYSGNYSAFVKQKEEALLKQEKDYEAQQKEIKRLNEWIEKWKNTPTKVSAAHSKERAIEHMELIEKPRRFDTTTFRAHFSPRISSYSEVLDVRNLSIGYDRELSRVSFRLMRGDRLAVTGENGKGKSTLLKTIIGEVPALGGNFKTGTNVEIGYYDQQKAVINDEDPEQTVLDNFWDTYPKLTNEQVRSTLGAFAFSQEEVDKKIGKLSGGERVRLALCKMFYTRPNLLILDEPTNHMDILGKESLEKMLKSYEGTVLFVSHDRYFINEIATGTIRIGEDTLPELRQEVPAKKNTDIRTDEITKIQGNNPGKLRSKLERRLEKLHEKLAAGEELSEKLKKNLEDPSVAADFQKLMDIQQQIEACDAEQEDLLMQILEAEEEVKNL